jgi:hypothetical protein
MMIYNFNYFTQLRFSPVISNYSRYNYLLTINIYIFRLLLEWKFNETTGFTPITVFVRGLLHLKKNYVF